MGDMVSPSIMLAIAMVVGMAEGIKRKWPNLSTTLVSCVASFIGAFGVANLDFAHLLQSFQSFFLNWGAILGISWLAYGTVVSRFSTNQSTNPQTPPTPPVQGK